MRYPAGPTEDPGAQDLGTWNPSSLNQPLAPTIYTLSPATRIESSTPWAAGPLTQGQGSVALSGLCALPSGRAVHSPSAARATAPLRHPSALAVRASLSPGSLERCSLLARELRQGNTVSAGASVDFGISRYPGTANFTTRETLTPLASLACP